MVEWQLTKLEKSPPKYLLLIFVLLLSLLRLDPISFSLLLLGRPVEKGQKCRPIILLSFSL